MKNLSDILAAIMRLAVPDMNPERRETWIRNQRLEPMVYGLEWEGVEWRASFLDECRMAYLNMTGRAVRFQAATRWILEAMSAKNIPACAWRGVTYGEQLYGDPGLRYCTDIDIMIDPQYRRMALEILENAGCELRNRFMPAWYLERHHLHWPLTIRDGNIPVDVHWAVDHPYRATRNFVDVTTMSQPAGMLIAGICHAEKESRLRYHSQASERLYVILHEGPVLPWIDLALMWDKSSLEDRSAVEDFFLAQDQRALWENSLIVINTFLKPDFSAALSTGSDKVHIHDQQHRLLGKFARVFGCRPEAMTDWVDYLFTPNNKRRGVSAAVEFAGRFARVLLLAIDTMACLIWMAWLKIRGNHRGAALG